MRPLIMESERNDEMKLDPLSLAAAQHRLTALDMVFQAQSGHPGGSLSAIEIVTLLYHEILRVDPTKPDDPDRDRFVLSKGHCTPALYPALADKGFFPKEDLKTFRAMHSYLSGHPERGYIPGVDMTTGSLGQGISAAVGMALAGKMDGKSYRVYTLLGDGELDEGQVWEAAMSAAKFRLDNLCAIVDVNGLQIDGPTADVMPIEPLDQKFEAFGWHVVKCDGHDFDALRAAFAQAAATTDKPTVLLAQTVKGKGVSFMENNAGWHGKAPNEEQYRIARGELEAQLAAIEKEVG